MGGGLLQLVSYGAQDIYISGNPQVTFWKVLYKRHTNFAMESIEVTFNGQADFNKRVTAVINRNADLMYRTYVQVVLPAVDLVNGGTNLRRFRWLNYIGHRLIKVERPFASRRLPPSAQRPGDFFNRIRLMSAVRPRRARCRKRTPK